MWLAREEGAKFWLSVMNELGSRGGQDVPVAVVDGLKGFPEAIEAVFPDAVAQTCIVHLMRHSLARAAWKERRELAAAIRPIHQAPTAEAAAAALDGFEAGPWNGKYPAIAGSWRAAWDRVVPFFAFSAAIRRAVYTTNAIESPTPRCAGRCGRTAASPATAPPPSWCSWRCATSPRSGATRRSSGTPRAPSSPSASASASCWWSSRLGFRSPAAFSGLCPVPRRAAYPLPGSASRPCRDSTRAAAPLEKDRYSKIEILFRRCRLPCCRRAVGALQSVAPHTEFLTLPGHLVVHSRATAFNARRFFRDLLAFMRVVSAQVDGGSEFMAEFEDECRRRGIDLAALPPRRPQWNGCVERANDTSRTEFRSLCLGDFTVDAANAEYRKLPSLLQQRTAHRGIGMMTPTSLRYPLQAARNVRNVVSPRAIALGIFGGLRGQTAPRPGRFHLQNARNGLTRRF